MLTAYFIISMCFFSIRRSDKIIRTFQKTFRKSESKSSEPRLCRWFVKSGTQPDAAVRVRTSVIDVRVPHPVVRAIVPVPATIRAASNSLIPIMIFCSDSSWLLLFCPLLPAFPTTHDMFLCCLIHPGIPETGPCH